MKEKVEFKNMYFDKDNKTFTILKGKKGTYSYTDIVKCYVANDDAKFEGKEEPFKHTVIGDVLQPLVFTNKYVYVGVIFEMKDHSKIYVYVSDDKTPVQTLQYYEDKRNADDIKAFTKNIISKYNPTSN
ncbi:hypothetical protein [Breznakia pachnodae]|uniref:Uncharacterized protein n=1 Tax=Breznakia pachnodae TaxID=265178 RepID=A0ABU0E1N0_9FIRM|nr:hypothetical protein [Breznakia pachnodae]MDQ0360798.1 hypothetical protein [Breznakia pachnodae]